MDYFGYLDSDRMTSPRFHDLLDGPPREPESQITRREIDIAASIQKVTEEIMLGLARHAREITGKPNLCLAGGVALNCVSNGVLLREKIFDQIWVQPAAGDAGGALGAALAASHLKFAIPRVRRSDGRDSQSGTYLGPAFTSGEVRAFLDRNEYPYEVISDRAARAERIAQVLDAGGIVGFHSGRMEFGPRSLGARSILGDPRNSQTQTTMNLKIKYRESFRPFAPSVLEEKCAEYFDLDAQSPYMLLVAPVQEARQLEMDREGFDGGDDDLMALVNQPRSDIPAITHVDYSARIQTVSKEVNPEFYAVIQAFEARSGCPVVVNTSFNVRGEPIVCSPQDAYRCFMRTEMDLLVLEDCLLEKEKQAPMDDDESWRDEYELD
jgi:carbamoyltransferase